MERYTPYASLIDSGFVAPHGAESLPFSRQLDRMLAGELAAEIFFQPIIDLRRGVVTGYEALARFPKELRTTPEACFARATQLGRRLDLEHMLCGMVLAQRSNLPQGCFLTMNLGPDYLLSEKWQHLLGTERDLSGVVIEITEETSISSYDAIRERSAQIRAMGGLVAVDDAGSGYASLQHILELRPDFIKLNRNFVKDCHLDRAKSTMIEMMGAAADRLDAWIIAEGVETIPELEELIRIGVPLAQGYLLAHPEIKMQGVNAQVAAELSRRSNASREKTLDLHKSPSAVCSSVQAAEELLRLQQEYVAAIVIDRWKRPTEMLHRHALLGLRIVEGFSKVQISCTPRQVLYRALTRDVKRRFDPMVVINNEGECEGVVEVDRLMSSVLSLEANAVAE